MPVINNIVDVVQVEAVTSLLSRRIIPEAIILLAKIKSRLINSESRLTSTGEILTKFCGNIRETMTNITCVIIDHAMDMILCNGVAYKAGNKKLKPDETLFWVYLVLYVLFMLFAGCMSGLTIGLLSLGQTQLQVLQKAGKPEEKLYASRIFPLVKRHHLLLVTLLLSNAAAVESMPIFMDRITHPVIAVLISVTMVLLFGEIIPQALCTRYGLAIGYYLSPIVYFLTFVLFIIAWPISKLLDHLLGTSHTTFFRRAELKELVDIHRKVDIEANEEPLTLDEALIIKGALDLNNKVARDYSRAIETVFMLPDDTKLNYETMTLINKKGHSRIPVYNGTKENIVGLLLVKSIIAADPEDWEPITKYMKTGNYLHSHDEDKPLYDILNECQKGKCHLCFIRNKVSGKIMGIITLEDIIEEILQEEITDETDVCKGGRKGHLHKVARIRTSSLLFMKTNGMCDSSTLEPYLVGSFEKSGHNYNHNHNYNYNEKTPLVSYFT